MDKLLYDLRAAVRHWRQSPGLAILAVTMIGLAAGGTLALTFLANGLIFRELPVRQPSRLVGLTFTDPNPAIHVGLPMAAVAHISDRVSAFSAVAGVAQHYVTAVSGEARWSVGVNGVTARYFELLGIAPAFGRFITPEEVGVNARLAVIGHDYWRRRLDGNPDVVGQTISLQGRPFTIVGVTRQSFFGLQSGEATDITIPLGALPEVVRLSAAEVPPAFVIARLADDEDLSRARTQLEVAWPSILRETLPGAAQWERDSYLARRVEVQSARTGVSGSLLQPYRRPLLLLIVASGLVTLLACLNLSTLLLARSAAREHSLSVRSALGASRARLVIGAFAEAMVLAVAGTVVSVPIAVWSVRAIGRIAWWLWESPPFDPTPDSTMLIVTAVYAMCLGLVVGLLPAYRATRPDVLQGVRSAQAPVARTQRWGRRLLVAQIALGSVLFVVALTAVSHLRQLVTRPGVATADVSVMAIDKQAGGQSAVEPAAYTRRLVDELSTIPGVDAVSFVDDLPGGYSSDLRLFKRPITRASDAIESGIGASVLQVSPGFLETLSLPILRGRDIRWTDDSTHPLVAVLSAALARDLFGGADPVGQRIRIGTGPKLADVEVVGITQDARITSLHDPHPRFAFGSWLQTPEVSPWILIRADRPLTEIAREARKRVEGLGQDYVMWHRSMAEQVSISLLRERLIAIGAGYFAVLVLVMLVIGLAGVLSYAVERRTRELGIRSALGASPRSLLALILGDSLSMSVNGSVIGLPVAWIVATWMSRLLGLEAGLHYTVLLGTAAITLSVAIIAGWLPARRAARAEVATALRTM